MARHGKKRIRFGSRDKKTEDFVDPNKDPRSYIKRYILEEKYREWFDRNYPDNTIYNAVGLNEWDYNEIKKKFSADQTPDDTKTEPEPEPEFADVPLAPSSDTPEHGTRSATSRSLRNNKTSPKNVLTFFSGCALPLQ